MAMSYAPTKLAVPNGFEEIITAFAKDVLQKQPANIYEHAAAYFRSTYTEMLQSGGFGPTDKEADKEGNEEIDFEDPAVEDAAVQIQSAYRGHLARKATRQARASYVEDDVAVTTRYDCSDPELNAAATKIQSAFRGSQTRNALEEQRLLAEEEKLLGAIDLSDPAVEAAAGKIQAGFRGFQVRKSRGRISSRHSSRQSSRGTAAAEKDGDADASL
eukprot:m.52124 g.52124  ORF g.52124 m.52124 type:complete len:216 (+) comp15384_c1_seq1:292-939(+)